MISNTTKRTILRCLHLILSIPILGYIYGEPAEFNNTPPLPGLSLFQ